MQKTSSPASSTKRGAAGRSAAAHAGPLCAAWPESFLDGVSGYLKTIEPNSPRN
jgi:hypothetical protein